MAARVDRQLLGFVSALQVLASSPAFDRGDIDSLHRHAAEMKRILGSEILVKDASGQQLVNTRADLSGPLPLSLPEGDRKAIATRQPVVSDLFTGKAVQRPIVSVNVPIIRDGNVVGLVNAGIDPGRLSAVLLQAELPQDATMFLIAGASVDQFVRDLADHFRPPGA